ncbi:hypothetical protein NKDENANG_02126 [Candidatus Entotheonellaceae bacterium PAL068K]
MNTASPTFRQIKAQVAAIRQKVPKARVIGIHAAGKWTGESLQQDGPETFRIKQCDAPLQMRIALQDDDGTATQVLITSLDASNLGDDILVRLTKRRLFPIDSWQIVKTLFEACTIDPRVTRYGWIAEYLLDAVPLEGFPPVPGGFLDAETVWPILLGRQIGFADDRPDLLALLKWCIEAKHIERFQAVPESFRQAATKWLAYQAGPAAEAVLNCVVSNQRPDALAIGLAAGVVFNREAAGRLDKAAGKMEERYLGGLTPDLSVIGRWHTAATEVVRLQLTDAQVKRGQLNLADDILRAVQAEAYAYLSDASPLGFNQHLACFGTLLSKAVQSHSPTALEPLAEARQELLRHDQAQDQRRRLDRIDMALRLVRWLTRGHAAEPYPQSLAEAAAYHLAEGGFVDWARLSLRAGDPVRELSEAYARLFDKVTAVREQQSCRFAELLRDWTAAGSVGDQVMPVERILDEIIGPLAAQAPVLVIVIDGMSVAVCRELLTDLTRQDWTPLCEARYDANRPGLATMPSVTETSRTSMLCGRLRQGNATAQTDGFAEHPGLLAHCRSGSPPVLFHQLWLQEADDSSLAAEVAQQISSSHRRVVGVIVNAVNDHLLQGEPIDTRWSRDEIKVLPTLLHEAKSARRVVVLLADHGHVLEHQTQRRPSESGERWRRDDGKPAEDELQITGSRVVMPNNHRLIAPWTEKVRYGIKKNGYQGGLSPQEMIIPITVLCATDTFPAGWREEPIGTPAWWDEPFDEGKPGEEAPPRLKPLMLEEPGLLFDFEPQVKEAAKPPGVVDVIGAEAIPEWVKALLASPILGEQKKLAGRAGPADEILSKLLVALEGRGGKLTEAALAREIDYPPRRLPGLLAVMQRVLNVDGYAILMRDETSDTVELNRGLLLQQFDLV